MQLAVAASDCLSCPAKSYLAESGSARLADGRIPCLPCPEGTVAVSSAPGQAICKYAEPGFAATSAGNLKACPPGTSSYRGATACFPLRAQDASTAESFQRLLPVASGNIDSQSIFLQTARFGGPVLGAALLPYLLLALANALGCACVMRRVLRPALERVDRYSMRSPEKRGGHPTLRPSALGGALTLVSLGVVAALIIFTVLQFLGSNTLLQQSVLPLTLASAASFKYLPLAQVAPGVAEGIIDPALLALIGPGGPGSGFSVTVMAMGSKCGTLYDGTEMTASSISGNFTYSSEFNATSCLARHVFVCRTCSLNILSVMKVTLHASCGRSTVVTVAAVGAGGGASSCTLASPTASSGTTLNLPFAFYKALAFSFPVQLEVVQDNVQASRR